MTPFLTPVTAALNAYIFNVRLTDFQLLALLSHNTFQQARKVPLENFSPPLEKCVGYSLKISDIVQKIWAPLRKLFAPPGVPSWLRACFSVSIM